MHGRYPAEMRRQVVDRGIPGPRPRSWRRSASARRRLGQPPWNHGAAQAATLLGWGAGALTRAPALMIRAQERRGPDRITSS